MFYNSKKLIDEKVLQQYFFECFMLADSAERRRLLPQQFRDYAASSTLKGLDPEVDVGRDENGRRHITDFVLYPMPSTGLPTLNIEIKWRAEDFRRQQNRFCFYDGRRGRAEQRRRDRHRQPEHEVEAIKFKRAVPVAAEEDRGEAAQGKRALTVRS